VTDYNDAYNVHDNDDDNEGYMGLDAQILQSSSAMIKSKGFSPYEKDSFIRTINRILHREYRISTVISSKFFL
jgi:hypothetical protein